LKTFLFRRVAQG